jgi:hypothetical protein
MRQTDFVPKAIAPLGTLSVTTINCALAPIVRVLRLSCTPLRLRFVQYGDLCLSQTVKTYRLKAEALNVHLLVLPVFRVGEARYTK